MPAAAGPAGPQGEQCDTGATGDTGPAGSARPQGPKGDVGDTAPMGGPGATSPQEPPAPFGELTRVHSDELTIPSGETNAATASRPDGRSRRAAGRSSRPGAGRPCRCLTAPTAAPAGPCTWAIPRQARRPRYAPSLADVPRREKARAAGGTVEEAASRSARHGRRAQRGSGSPLSRRPAPFMRTLPGISAPVRWCGGARQTRSVGPRGAVGRPREAASAERDVEGALGARTVQALQADDDATSAVSRPWGPDATGPGHTTTPGGRQNRGHPMLPDRASPTSWRGRCTPPQTARRFDHSPGTWALPMGVGATSVTPGRKLRARAGTPWICSTGVSRERGGVRLCPPSGWQGGSRTLFSDPVPGSSVRVVCPHAGECPTTIRPRRWRRRRAGPSRATSASARTPFRGA